MAQLKPSWLKHPPPRGYKGPSFKKDKAWIIRAYGRLSVQQAAMCTPIGKDNTNKALNCMATSTYRKVLTYLSRGWKGPTGKLAKESDQEYLGRGSSCTKTSALNSAVNTQRAHT